jgi:hypothetical protein
VFIEFSIFDTHAGIGPSMALARWNDIRVVHLKS